MVPHAGHRNICPIRSSLLTICSWPHEQRQVIFTVSIIRSAFSRIVPCASASKVRRSASSEKVLPRRKCSVATSPCLIPLSESRVSVSHTIDSTIANSCTGFFLLGNAVEQRRKAFPQFRQRVEYGRGQANVIRERLACDRQGKRFRTVAIQLPGAG